MKVYNSGKKSADFQEFDNFKLEQDKFIKGSI